MARFLRNTLAGALYFIFLHGFPAIEVSAFAPLPSSEALSVKVQLGVPTPLITSFQRSMQVEQAAARASPTALFGSVDPRSVDGTGGRGLVVMGLTLTLCVWLFSIPPEFRRAHFCAVERCVQNREKCYDCVTVSEWVDGVSAYYKNGGGIDFDFTVAEETKQFWKDAISK